MRFRSGAGAACVGRSLKELNLRGLTGATVLAIERGAGESVVPAADERLRENDVLVLTGTQEAVAAACELLGQASQRPRVATRRRSGRVIQGLSWAMRQVASDEHWSGLGATDT